MISKKTTLLISGLVAIILTAIGIFGTYTLCNKGENCINVLHFLFLHLIPFLPLFVFSLITYWMREEVYQAWFRFARWWIPLSMIAIFLAPEYSGDWMYRIEKGSIALLTGGFFVVISIVIIAIRLLRHPR